MTERTRLPNRRTSETFDLEVMGLRFTATVSRFVDGEVAEIFLRNHKCDSGAGILANDGAIAASLALQFGCPVETLRRALSRDARGRASGPLGAALDRIADDEGAA
jgi:ribonucleoside-diphosphate reductase alpha chain